MARQEAGLQDGPPLAPGPAQHQTDPRSVSAMVRAAPSMAAPSDHATGARAQGGNQISVPSTARKSQATER